MAHYNLDEFEADEIFHALTERKGTLESRVKSLSEKDGLPEAADAVRKRIALYMPSGEGDDHRSGLIRLFAPQRDLEAERNEERAGEERDAAGGQDLFGGGAETGGGTPAGQIEPAKAKRGRGKKDKTAEPPLTDSVAQATADPVELALEQLAALAIDLLAGDATVTQEIFRGYAVPVLDLLPKANDGIDRELLTKTVNEEIGEDTDNAHALAYLIQRQVDAIRESREKPVGRREEAHGPDGAPPGIEAGAPSSTLEGSNAATSDASPTSNADAGVATSGLSFAPSAAAEE